MRSRYARFAIENATSLSRVIQTVAESLDASQSDAELTEPKQNAKMVIRRLNRNSEPQASIEAGQYSLQYVFSSSLLLRAQAVSLSNLRY